MSKLYEDLIGLNNENKLLNFFNKYFNSKIYQECIDELNLQKEKLDKISLDKYTLEQLEKAISTNKRFETEIILSKLIEKSYKLQPKKFLEIFSEETLFWSVAKRYNEQTLKEYSKITNKNFELLEKAYRSILYVENSTNSQSMMKMYEVFIQTPEILKNINLEEKILKYSKPEIKSRISRYSLQQIFIPRTDTNGYDPEWYFEETLKDTFDTKSRQIYLDAPAGILLKYDEEPAALTSFIITENQDLKIYQIQGINEKINQGIIQHNKRSKKLFDIDWKEILVSITEDLAKQLNIPKICIQSAENNEWTKGDFHAGARLSFNRAEKIYDNTAKFMGYIRCKDKNWYKELE